MTGRHVTPVTWYSWPRALSVLDSTGQESLEIINIYLMMFVYNMIFNGVYNIIYLMISYSNIIYIFG